MLLLLAGTLETSTKWRELAKRLVPDYFTVQRLDLLQPLDRQPGDRVKAVLKQWWGRRVATAGVFAQHLADIGEEDLADAVVEWANRK